jgi:hypothetical protein
MFMHQIKMLTLKTFPLFILELRKTGFASKSRAKLKKREFATRLARGGRNLGEKKGGKLNGRPRVEIPFARSKQKFRFFEVEVDFREK